MTVVARIAINSYPILIGDLLLSVEDPPALVSSVPTAENLSALFPVGVNRVPCGMRQKVAVVADNLVVGWSGGLDTAGDVIAELMRKSASEPFTFKSLTDHFDRLPKSVWDDVSLVGLIDERNNQVVQWGRGDHLLVDTELFGKVGLVGSGREDVRKMLADIPRLPVGFERPLLGPEQALSACLQLTGNLMQLEISTRRSLAKFYGGGYEIATTIDDKYQKVSDITYLFWRIGIEGDGIRFGFAPYMAFRYAYEKDLLLIRSVRFDDSKEVSTVTDMRLYYAEPVYREANQGEIAQLKSPTLNSPYLCVYFLLPTENGIAVVGAVHRKSNPEDKKWVTFTETPAGITGIEVEQEFLREIAKVVCADPHFKRQGHGRPTTSGKGGRREPTNGN